MSWGASFSFVRLATSTDSLGFYMLLFGSGGAAIALLAAWIWHLDMKIKWSIEMVLLLLVFAIVMYNDVLRLIPHR